jgi:Co/Zn/Cd efflux system component
MILFNFPKALPVSVNYDLVLKDLCEIEHIKNARNLHVWSLTVDKIALSVNLIVDQGIDTQKILNDTKELLRFKYNIETTTIQIEHVNEKAGNFHV